MTPKVECVSPGVRIEIVCRDWQEVCVVAVPVAAPVAANKGGASLKHLGMMQLPPEKVVNLLKDQNTNPSAV